MKINPEFKSLIPPLSQEEYAQLEENLLKNGIREPISLWKDTIIDGHNRYEIAQRHSLLFSTINYEFSNGRDAECWIIKNQFGRRNLPAYMRGALALRLEPLLSEQAKEKERERKTTFQKSEKSYITPVNTVKELAKIAGISHDTLSRVKTIETQAPIELKEKVKSGELSISQAYQQVRREQREQRREDERIENAEKVATLDNPLEAQGLFQTIVIDPPWDWGDEGDINQMGRAKPDYATMPIAEIEALPINKIADENCHLYLWVTNRSLPKAFRLIEAWGFRYVTCITWVKPSFGMGNYFRGSTEQVLFAVKGSQPLKRKDVGTHFTAPRGNGHSAKPDAFYDLVRSCSHAPYIDIFGRKERDGWTVWGEAGDS